MVVQIVNVNGMASLEAEYYSPICPYRYRPEVLVFTFKTMKPEAGQVHILRGEGCIQPRQNVSDDFAMIRVNAACVAPLEKSLKRPVPETLDHGEL